MFIKEFVFPAQIAHLPIGKENTKEMINIIHHLLNPPSHRNTIKYFLALFKALDLSKKVNKQTDVL